MIYLATDGGCGGGGGYGGGYVVVVVVVVVGGGGLRHKYVRYVNTVENYMYMAFGRQDPVQYVVQYLSAWMDNHTPVLPVWCKYSSISYRQWWFR